MVRRCCFVIELGFDVGPSIWRRTLTVSSVRRSHFEDVEERETVCHSAVLRMKGVLGTSNLSSAEGEASMVGGGKC